MEKIAILGTGDTPSPDAVTPEPIVSAAKMFRPELRSVPGSVFPDSPAARETCVRAYLEAGQSAEQAGFAGLYINTVGDYGLNELRLTSGIPATGAGEGAIRAAQARGQRFAIVTIWPPALRFIYDAVLASTDSASDCLGIHHVSVNADLATLGQPSNFVQDMQSCNLTSMARIREACHKGLDEKQADVIILGCTCMYPVAALLEADGFPVIEPMASGYRYLESLIAQNN